jgi:HEPN domain-containing protein
MRREILLWFQAAYEDLEDAKDAFNRRRWFRAAFFSQQCVEKALKSLFFILRREEPPKIHSVTELYLLLKESGLKLKMKKACIF